MADRLAKFRVGYVADPLPGHDSYRGMLAIPYLRWSPGSGWSVVQIRFRCFEDHDHRENYHGKYNTVAGEEPTPYNTVALLGNHDRVGIAEGEFDAVTATVCGIPTVGIAGVESWKDHYPLLFEGFEEVLIFADNDDNGQGYEFAKAVKKSLPNGKVIRSRKGHDVGSEVLEYGAKAWRERVGI